MTANFYLNGATLSKWALAVAAVKAGTRNAKMLDLGDSTTAGCKSVPGSAYFGSNDIAYSYPSQLAPLLATKYGTASNWSSMIGDYNCDNSAYALPPFDSRINLGTGWTYLNEGGGNSTLGGGSLVSPSTTVPLTFLPLNEVDTFVIGYLQYNSAGYLGANVNGGAALAGTPVNCTTSGANAQAYITVTAPLGYNTLNLFCSSGNPVYINYIYAYNSAIKEISVLNAGWAQALASNLIVASGNGGAGWAPLGRIGNIAPDLTVFMMGINDWAAATSVTTFTSQLQTVITEALISGDVILMSGVPSETTVVSQATQATYVAAMNSLAATNGIMFIDIWNLMNSGSWAANNTAGVMADNEHPNETGYGLIAGWVEEGLGLVGPQAYALSGAPGPFALTGKAASISAGRKFSLTHGTFVGTANSAALKTGRYLTLSPSAFVLNGSNAALKVTYRVTGTTGVFVKTGPALATSWGHRLPGTSGTFSNIGSPSVSKIGKKLAGGSGVFASVGSALNISGIIYHYQLAATTGSFSASGFSTTTVKGYQFNLTHGVFAETGHTVKIGFGLSGATSSFALTGRAANFGTFNFPVIHGSFGLLGFNITTAVHRQLAGATGSFGLAGHTANLIRHYQFSETPGAFTAVQLTTYPVYYTFTVPQGSFALTGSLATPKTVRKFAGAPASFSEIGTASISAGRKLSAGTGSFAVSPATAITLHGYNLPLASGTFAETGQDLNFTFHRCLTAPTGSFALSAATHLTFGKNLPGATGSFIKTGRAITAGFGLPATTGRFAETSPGASYSVALSSQYAYGFNANTLAFGLTGHPLAMKRGYWLTGTTGAFGLIGESLKTKFAFHLAAATGIFNPEGSSVTFPAGNNPFVTGAKGLFGLYGNNAQLTCARNFVIHRGIYGLSGIAITAASLTGHSLETGNFGIQGRDATFSLGFAMLGPNVVQIPNGMCPVDLLLYKINNNTWYPLMVETTLANVQMPNQNDDNNLGLAWYGPYPPAGTPLSFVKPPKANSVLKANVSLFS